MPNEFLLCNLESKSSAEMRPGKPKI